MIPGCMEYHVLCFVIGTHDELSFLDSRISFAVKTCSAPMAPRNRRTDLERVGNVSIPVALAACLDVHLHKGMAFPKHFNLA